MRHSLFPAFPWGKEDRLRWMRDALAIHYPHPGCADPLPVYRPRRGLRNVVFIFARSKATRQSAENSRVRPRELTRRAKSEPGFRKVKNSLQYQRQVQVPGDHLDYPSACTGVILRERIQVNCRLVTRDNQLVGQFLAVLHIVGNPDR